jgi:hypothetical protein
MPVSSARIMLFFVIVASPCWAKATAFKPGEPIDYKKYAFKPQRWAQTKKSTMLYPWVGKEVVFLTTTSDLDSKVMKQWVDRLDGGWGIYANLVGRRPRAHKHMDGKVTIGAVPDGSYSCGVGCGFIGATGIELGKFYREDYPKLVKQPQAFPHYAFYEMGRNYYVFGKRHDLFVTGFAVFMRYVCMDALKCEDYDAKTRKTIEACEALYAESDIPFMKAFTNVASKQGEKGNRLKIHPSDQPVMYTTAMLKLRKDYGGDAWCKKFFAALHQCPEVDAKTLEGATKQCLNWLVSASIGAGKDLSLVFVDRWRMPLTKDARAALAKIDWTDEKLDPAKVIQSLK